MKNYLTATGNEAGIQRTTSGGMDALQQILVIEYTPTVTAPVAAFSGTGGLNRIISIDCMFDDGNKRAIFNTLEKNWGIQKNYRIHE